MSVLLGFSGGSPSQLMQGLGTPYRYARFQPIASDDRSSPRGLLCKPTRFAGKLHEQIGQLAVSGGTRLFLSQTTTRRACAA